MIDLKNLTYEELVTFKSHLKEEEERRQKALNKMIDNFQAAFEELTCEGIIIKYKEVVLDCTDCFDYENDSTYFTEEWLC